VIVEYLKMHLLHICHWVWQWNNFKVKFNFKNQSVFVEIMGKSLVSCFFDSQCSIVINVAIISISYLRYIESVFCCLRHQSTWRVQCWNASWHCTGNMLHHSCHIYHHHQRHQEKMCEESALKNYISSVAACLPQSWHEAWEMKDRIIVAVYLFRVDFC